MCGGLSGHECGLSAVCAAVSTVLLKNAASVLPLQKGAKIALIGFATDGAVVHAGGSGSVVPSFIVTPLSAQHCSLVRLVHHASRLHYLIIAACKSKLAVV